MSSHTGLSVSIPPPVYKNRFLIFDVETNGLLPKSSKNGIPTPITDYPHILQLSYAIYDYSQKKVIKKYNAYIDIDDSVDIPEKVIEITGITRDICKEKGKPIAEVLEKFYEAYMFCQILVAHNITFDEKMISIELERNRPTLMKKSPYCFMTFNPTYEEVHGIERYCTMRKGTDLCNILVESKIEGRPPNKKWPRLNELYAKLFDGETVNGLHDSMVDVLVCLRCYLKMRHGFQDDVVLKQIQ